MSWRNQEKYPPEKHHRSFSRAGHATFVAGASGQLVKRTGPWASQPDAVSGKLAVAIEGTRPEPFNFTPIGVNSISPAHLHVRPTHIHMGRTCR